MSLLMFSKVSLSEARRHGVQIKTPACTSVISKRWRACSTEEITSEKNTASDTLQWLEPVTYCQMVQHLMVLLRIGAVPILS